VIGDGCQIMIDSNAKLRSIQMPFCTLIFIGTVSDIIGVRIDSKYIMAIIIWLYFLSGGYIQWFVLSKRIINK
ncbi:hypothetical protein P4I15_25045, partial [Escherichia coli]